MKLIEVAAKVLTRRQRECWFQRRIEGIEPEEVARRMGICYSRVIHLTWEANRTLADHAADIEDPDDTLVYMVSILRGHRVENAVDQTARAVMKREERQNFANKTGQD